MARGHSGPGMRTLSKARMGSSQRWGLALLGEVKSAFLRGPSASQGKPGTQGALLRPEVAFSLHLEDGGGHGVFRFCQEKLSAGHRDRQIGRGGG